MHPDPRERVADATATARARSRGAGTRGRARRRGSRTPGPRAPSRHRRALDVPAGPADAPRRLPRRVLALLGRLPEREVARVLLARVRLLLLDLVGPLARERAVGRRSARRGSRRRRPTAYAWPAASSSLDQRDDLGDRLGRERLRVGHPEPEAAPCPRGTSAVASSGPLGAARPARPRRSCR